MSGRMGWTPKPYGEMADRVEKACYQNPYQPGFRSDRFTEEQKRSLYSTAATSTWFGGHMAMDYEKNSGRWGSVVTEGACP